MHQIKYFIFLFFIFIVKGITGQIGHFQGDVFITDLNSIPQFKFVQSSNQSNFEMYKGAFLGIDQESSSFNSGGRIKILGTNDNELNLAGNSGGIGSSVFILQDNQLLLDLRKYGDIGSNRHGHMRIRSISNAENIVTASAALAPYNMITLENEGLDSDDSISWNIGLVKSIVNTGIGSDYTNALTFALSESGGSTIYRAVIEDDGDFHQLSDQRYKENIFTVEEGLHTLMQLSPKSYTFKNQVGTKRNFGFLAQELQQVLPDLIFSIKDPKSTEETLLVNYTGLIPFITSAIQEQQQMIQSTNSGYQTLKSEVDLIRTELERVKKMLENLDK